MRARDVMYLHLPNKLPVQQRLYRIRLKPDPYCQYCPGAELGDIVHHFCGCQRTVETWTWVREQIIRYGQEDGDEFIFRKIKT